MKFILDTGQHTRCDSPSNTFERFNCFTIVQVHPIVLLRFQRIFTLTIAMNALSIIICTFYPFNLATNSLCLKSKTKATHQDRTHQNLNLAAFHARILMWKLSHCCWIPVVLIPPLLIIVVKLIQPPLRALQAAKKVERKVPS